MSRPAQPIIIVSKIDPAWRDYNGHLNYAAYAMAADPAVDAIYAAAGLDLTYRKRFDRSDYVVESRFIYLKEIRSDGSIEVRARLVGFDRKRTHIYCEIRDPEKNWLSAVAHIVSLHVDTALARSAEFESFALERFAAIKTGHDQLPPPDIFDDTVTLARRFPRSKSIPESQSSSPRGDG